MINVIRINIYHVCIRHSFRNFPEEIESESDFFCLFGHMSSFLKHAATQGISKHKLKRKIRSPKIEVLNDIIHDAYRRCKHFMGIKKELVVRR